MKLLSNASNDLVVENGLNDNTKKDHHEKSSLFRETALVSLSCNQLMQKLLPTPMVNN